MIRERFSKPIISAGFALLLVVLGRGAAGAQVRIVQQSHAGTIKITKPGSYILGSNINSSLTGFPLIQISASNVTVNLNGLSLIGPGTAGTATGIKVLSGFSGITIYNGRITKIAGNALQMDGSGIVTAMQLIANKGDGVRCTSNCLVTNSVITGNTGTGLNFGDATSGYQNNILSSNGANVAGGTSMSGGNTNVCDGSAC